MSDYIHEYLSLFESLRIEGYIFPVVNESGEPCFILNQAMGKEWLSESTITLLSRLKVAGSYTKKASIYLVGELFAAFLGGLVGFYVNKWLS